MLFLILAGPDQKGGVKVFHKEEGLDNPPRLFPVLPHPGGDPLPSDTLFDLQESVLKGLIKEEFGQLNKSLASKNGSTYYLLG